MMLTSLVLSISYNGDLTPVPLCHQMAVSSAGGTNPFSLIPVAASLADPYYGRRRKIVILLLE